MICEFRVHGDVVPWSRSGVSGKIHFTPQRQRNFMNVIRDAGFQAMRGGPPVDDPVELRLVATYLPKKRTRRERDHPAAAFKRSKPDLSNIQKIIEDSLNGIVWIDDSRVAVAHVAKVYGARPGLLVSVHPLTAASWPILAQAERAAA